MVELTMRLLVGPVILLATLSLPTQALGGINRGLRNNGRLPLSREEELTKALQFLEEYERNLEGKWVPENQYEDLGARDFMLDMDRVGDEDIVPGADQDDTIQPDNAGQFMNFLQSILQGVNRKNRDDVVPQEYLNPQRSALNNQYVLFSPLDADLEDEIALEETIAKLKTKERKEKLWEEILGDMLAEDILETEAKERIKELMDVEEEEEVLFREDSIFAEEDPWSDTDSFEAINDDDDVVPWSWASPDEDEFDEDTSSFVDEFDSTESLTSEDQRDIAGEAAVIILEDILANQEKTQKQEEEEEENEDILEMLTAEDEADLDDEDLTEEIYDSATEDALENYFKQLLENHDKSEETLEEVSEESDNIEDYSSQAPEELEDANDEVIQDYGDESDLENEDLTEEIYNSAMEDALNNYFKEMLENHDRSEETLEGVSEENENIEDYSSQAPDELEDPGNEVIQDYEDYDEDEDDEAEYHMLLREITNEIEAAAQEVEEEVAAALKDQLENNSQNNLLYLNEEDTGQIEEHDPSIENNELDASQILSLAGLLENYGEPRAADITTGSDTCPVYRWLVDDCAFIDSFPDVDASGIYRNIFQNACNRHQLCYTCGQSYDIESTLCNDVFDAEMIAKCGQNQECIGTAEQFVFIASNTYTRQLESPSFCEAKCLVHFLVRD